MLTGRVWPEDKYDGRGEATKKRPFGYRQQDVMQRTGFHRVSKSNTCERCHVLG